MQTASRRQFLASLAVTALATSASPQFTLAQAPPAPRPNVIFILADDLGYNDIEPFGASVVKTPSLSRLAAEGMRFTQSYCGTSVCAPSRCILMTGLHSGHAHIRANRATPPEGQEPLPEGTFTLPRMLQSAGYATAAFGKWGLGGPGSTGEPNRQGFDHFFGYVCQSKAHEYYPAYLWRNTDKVELDGKTYSHDLIAAESLKWLRSHVTQNNARPFFLYLPYTIPHGKYQVPDTKPYDDRNDLAPQLKTYASMITRMDADIGRLMDLLKELGVDQNTLIVFASDNGTANLKISPDQKLRGIKRSMYEGGLRSPTLARWPARIKPGTTSDQPWAFWDVLPTCAQVAGIQLPGKSAFDGISIAAAFEGKPLPPRDYLYWELHEAQSIQALRQGDWKLVKNGPDAKPELYNLKDDPIESNNLADAQPEVAARLTTLLKSARTDSPMWPMRKAKPKQRARAAKPG